MFFALFFSFFFKRCFLCDISQLLRWSNVIVVVVAVVMVVVVVIIVIVIVVRMVVVAVMVSSCLRYHALLRLMTES